MQCDKTLDTHKSMLLLEKANDADSYLNFLKVTKNKEWQKKCICKLFTAHSTDNIPLKFFSDFSLEHFHKFGLDVFLKEADCIDSILLHASLLELPKEKLNKIPPALLDTLNKAGVEEYYKQEKSMGIQN